MPKSKHRKNQKKKSKARTERLNAQKRAFNKQMQERFQKYMEEMKNKEMTIEEVTPKEENTNE